MTRRILPLLLSLLSPLLLSADKRDPLVTVGVGDFNFTGTHHKLLFQTEFKSSPFYRDLRWQAGGLITERASTYFYGGVAYDFYLGKAIVLTPSFSPGVYFKGNGKSLGCLLEFRSALALAYLFPKGARLGVEAYHISNASLGYRNPGVNTLALTLSLPLCAKKTGTADR